MSDRSAQYSVLRRTGLLSAAAAMAFTAVGCESTSWLDPSEMPLAHSDTTVAQPLVVPIIDDLNFGMTDSTTERPFLWATATWSRTPSWVDAGQQAADCADREFPNPNATHLPSGDVSLRDRSGRPVAAAASLALAAVWKFTLSSALVFRLDSTWRRFMLFMGFALAGLVVNTGVTTLAAVWLPGAMAKVAGIGVA